LLVGGGTTCACGCDNLFVSEEVKVTQRYQARLAGYVVEPAVQGDYVRELLAICNDASFRLALGSQFYVVSATWWGSWRRYVGLDSVAAGGEAAAHPGPISNAHLVDDGLNDLNLTAGHIWWPFACVSPRLPLKDSELAERREAVERNPQLRHPLTQQVAHRVDFEVVPELVWKSLKSWYGCDMEIPRVVLKCRIPREPPQQQPPPAGGASQTEASTTTAATTTTNNKKTTVHLVELYPFPAALVTHSKRAENSTFTQYFCLSQHTQLNDILERSLGDRPIGGDRVRDETSRPPCVDLHSLAQCRVCSLSRAAHGLARSSSPPRALWKKRPPLRWRVAAWASLCILCSPSLCASCQWGRLCRRRLRRSSSSGAVAAAGGVVVCCFACSLSAVFVCLVPRRLHSRSCRCTLDHQSPRVGAPCALGRQVPTVLAADAGRDPREQ
jgi:hypothetical protein